MNCRIGDLRYKDVVCVGDGTRLGHVSDVELDLESAALVSIVIYGRYKFFGIFGREEDIVITWSDIQLIGEDIILVRYSAPRKTEQQWGKWGK